MLTQADRLPFHFTPCVPAQWEEHIKDPEAAETNVTAPLAAAHSSNLEGGQGYRVFVFQCFSTLSSFKEKLVPEMLACRLPTPRGLGSGPHRVGKQRGVHLSRQGESHPGANSFMSGLDFRLI